MPDTRPSRNGSLHQRIARHVRTQIEAGVLRDREALPSTRELANQFDVSVFTANEAMQILVDEGLVVTKARSGRVVNNPSGLSSASARIATPHLIIVGGYAGCGKTEFGRILARATGWAILDKDTATRPVVEMALQVLDRPTHDRESPTYVERIRPREYEGLMAAATENIECGVSVITTAPFLGELPDPVWMARTRAQFERHGATVRAVWINCDLESMHTYLRQRGAARDSIKLDHWQTYSESLNLDLRPAEPHSVIDNSASAEPLQNQVALFVSALAEAKL
ncbi:MAG: GntR family transcriptional regulator [Ornithinimicrobium sp.]